MKSKCKHVCKHERIITDDTGTYCCWCLKKLESGESHNPNIPLKDSKARGVSSNQGSSQTNVTECGHKDEKGLFCKKCRKQLGTFGFDQSMGGKG